MENAIHRMVRISSNNASRIVTSKKHGLFLNDSFGIHPRRIYQTSPLPYLESHRVEFPTRYIASSSTKCPHFLLVILHREAERPLLVARYYLLVAPYQSQGFLSVGPYFPCYSSHNNMNRIARQNKTEMIANSLAMSVYVSASSTKDEGRRLCSSLIIMRVTRFYQVRQV